LMFDSADYPEAFSGEHCFTVAVCGRLIELF
jgi:hypothetical protein